jgi:toxin ParE1/3/4
VLDLLADNPDMGRKCEEIREGYHRHEYERHFIFYRKRKSDIFIAATIHNSMNINRVFGVDG